MALHKDLYKAITFFILRINDIVKVSTVLNPVLFADYTSLFHAHTDFDTLIEETNEELQKITTWFHTNKLSLKKIIFHNTSWWAYSLTRVDLDSHKRSEG